MATYDKLKSLPLEIEDIGVSALSHQVSDGFTRPTTVIQLGGRGEAGVGEDLSYELNDHLQFRSGAVALPLRGKHDLDSFCAAVSGLSLFSSPPEDPMAQSYRVWALQSAALDLALRQSGLSLATLLDMPSKPLRFVVSLGLGDPPTTKRIEAIVDQHPTLCFKIDAKSSWSSELMRSLNKWVDCVDLKGHYQGQSIYQAPEAELYQDVLDAFPEAWIEDAAISSQTESIVEENWARLSWDAPIHSLADVMALRHPPAAINIKPSRIGSLQALLDLYDHCIDRDIVLYGGGEFELGPGRRQIQHLASIFHPDAPNDVAPSIYNAEPLPGRLPPSPLPKIVSKGLTPAKGLTRAKGLTPTE